MDAEILGIAAFAAAGTFYVMFLVDTLRRLIRRTAGRLRTTTAAVTLMIGAHLLAVGFLVEPRYLVVERLSVRLPVEKPLRIAHISDLHHHRDTDWLDRVAEAVLSARPDVVAITGDYFSRTRPDRRSVEQVRTFLKRLCDRVPTVLSVGGNWDEPAVMESLMRGLPVLHENVAVRRGNVVFHCVTWGARLDTAASRRLLRGYFDAAGGGAVVRVMLFHSPELADRPSVRERVDLYLCGHTHGGQVRLPFWGALFTASMTGKRYETGLYRLGRCRLYVNRGVGTALAPFRLNCPPEVAIIDILPEAATAGRKTP